MKNIYVLLLILFAFTGNTFGSDWGAMAGGGTHNALPVENWIQAVSKHQLELGGTSYEAGLVKFNKGSPVPSWGITVGRDTIDLAPTGSQRYRSVLGSPGQIAITRLTVRKYFNISFGKRAGLMPFVGGGIGWGTATPDARYTSYQQASRTVPIPEVGLQFRLSPTDRLSITFGISASPVPSLGAKGFSRF
jgi:hypothetical protein